VVYKADLRAKGFSVSAETAGRETRLGFKSDRRFRHAIRGFAAALSDRQAARLRGDPEVALVSLDREVRAATVPIIGGDQSPTGVSRIEAAAAGTVRDSSGVAVAVLDTGIDLAHPDLNAQNGVNCVGPGPALDNNGHGTQVAGVIGARNNGAGVVGVAPGTKLVSVKVLDSQGNAFLSDLICGIDWVTAHAASLGIKVANLSLAGLSPPSTCDTDPLHLALCNSTAAGVTNVVAAGNETRDFGTSPVPVPASYPEVLAVTAMSDTDGRAGGAGPPPACPDGIGEADDRFVSFSNYASWAADSAHTIAAPGVCIRSTAPSGLYDTSSGTSLAAPHVSGTVALCFNEAGHEGPCAGLRPADVIAKIRADAARVATPVNGFLGDPNSQIGRYYGFLVSVVESTKPLPPPPPPPVAESQSATPPDRSVSFRIASVRSRKNRLYVWVQMNEPGSLRASGTVRLPRQSSSHRYRSAGKKVVSAGRTRLILRLARRSERIVKRALRRGLHLRAHVVIRVTDASGNRGVARRGVRVKR
jgi:subtilisin